MSSSAESSTRRDLLETIESQREAIAKYERRLRDVVKAYKGLAKEKEALEDTLKAISREEHEDDDSQAEERDADKEDGSEAGEGGAAKEAADDASSTTSGGSAKAKKGSSEAKVRTLTASIATLAAEKSRLEATFQEDRRKLLQEVREGERRADEAQKELAAVRARAKQEAEEAKSKLIIERHEREKETSDHAVMIRELQKLLAEERRAKEKADSARQEAEDKLKKLETAGSKNEEYERRVKVLEGKLKFKSDELDQLNKQLKEVKTVEVQAVKKDLAESRKVHQRELERAERRAESAEARAAEVRVEQEQRVRALEARLHELSETVGTYDRLRQHDMAEIQSLRDKIQEASQGNAESESGRQAATSRSIDDDADGLDVQALLDRFYRLKTVIREANAKSQSPAADLDALLSDENINALRKRNDALQKEVDALKREKAAGAKTPSPQGRGPRYLLPEVDQEVVLSLRTQISELQDKVALLRTQLLEEQSRSSKLAKNETDLQAAITAFKTSSKERQEALESDYRAKILGLETELQKQRDRCLTLIEEKEDEVNMLKSNMELAFEKTFAAATASAAAAAESSSSTPVLSPEREKELQLRRAAASSIASTAGSGRKSRKTSFADYEDSGSITDKLKSSSPNEGMVLHYVQELSLKDVEIGNLRRQVFEVEAAMRELQMSAVSKEEKYVDQIDTLNDTVARLKRMEMVGGGGGKSGGDGGVSMEYLKNVVLSYMLSSDAASRDHMLKAIGAVLFFTKQEVKQVRDYNLSWFWTHGQGAVTKKGHK